MREQLNHIDYYGIQIPFVCNINVLEVIQHKYGSFTKWSELIAPDVESKDFEPDYTALKFGFTAMINEGIDIENEINNEEKPFKTEKQVARIISAVGINAVSEQIAGEIIGFSPEVDGDEDATADEFNLDDEDEELKN